MKLAANLLKISLLLVLLPASASAITITISAPSNSSTELTVTATGDAYISHGSNQVAFSDIGDYITYGTGPDDEYFNLSSGITASHYTEETATRIYLDADNGRTISNDDDLRIVFDDLFGMDNIYTFSGSATIDLSSANHNFGQFNIGTYEKNGDTFIVQYSSVPDTGSTAALLGAGVFVLAAARRRLG
ncbi:VPDSG-CTERM sorting domain-containing protein [Candidatus Pelagisphaera phototrophica]|uniref:VPDSG-CTERM sorting domain-containing protein n=1 Tax=Candidatus Pelagisphaera phototrophica TaxID=2684113 RepID=UPI0024B7AF22|nr:VPDSG-CTERM sorting domain-containing protein [Candidatus Pelagisphaera phototrophica]QXD30739.1 VPDSG-CTERM sorting domain-containing protein [Candidatus Pelagisphaera phototrophica]